MDSAGPYHPIDPHGTSDLLQNIPFLIESQRQTTYRHVLRLRDLLRLAQEGHLVNDPNALLDHRIIRRRALDDVEKLVQLLRDLLDDTAEKRATWRRVALGLSIPALLLNKEVGKVLSQAPVQGPALIGAVALVCQSVRREAAPMVGARLERQLTKAVTEMARGSDGQEVLDVLDNLGWKALQYF
ncbi:hypothetical protein V8F06_007116 [Rhypophila decipiens]